MSRIETLAMFRKNAAKNFKYIRKELNLNQQQLSEKLNVKRSLIGAIEEERALSIWIVHEMCNFINVSIDTILKTDMSDK